MLTTSRIRLGLADVGQCRDEFEFGKRHREFSAAAEPQTLIAYDLFCWRCCCSLFQVIDSFLNRLFLAA